MGEVIGEQVLAGQRLLEYRYSPALLPDSTKRAPAATMWRYRGLLPVAEGPILYPLPIGGTPLLPAPRLGTALGLAAGRLWLKDETWGPSASNKDRATALVIEAALRDGIDTVTTASTGNAAVSTAIGAAAAGMQAVIFVGTDCRSQKVTRMLAAGARVFGVPGGYTAATALSRAAASSFGWADRNTGVNPATIEAKKTVAFEIWEQLGRVPDAVAVPVGDGPTLVGIAKGFRELVQCRATEKTPVLIGVQAASCSPLVRAWQHGAVCDVSLGMDDPTGTAADGIAVVDPSSGGAALAEVVESEGLFLAVDEDAIAAAVERLAVAAGVEAEPAGAASVAGVAEALTRGGIAEDATVVALITGRDPGGLQASKRLQMAPEASDLDSVRRLLGIRG